MWPRVREYGYEEVEEEEEQVLDVSFPSSRIIIMKPQQDSTVHGGQQQVELNYHHQLLLVLYTIKMVCCGVSARSTRESFDNIFSIIIIIISSN